MPGRGAGHPAAPWQASWLLLLLLCVGIVGCISGTPQSPDPRVAAEVPGTATRPQLTAAQAMGYSRQRVLGATGPAGQRVEDGWDPLADPVITGHRPPLFHYHVQSFGADGLTRFATVQAAVNRAHHDVLAGVQTAPRIYIGVSRGDYDELVYVPAGPVPITLWGVGVDAKQVRIHHAIDAGVSGADYARRHAAVYEAADMHPDIAALYRSCRQQAVLGTGCAAVMWVRQHGFQLRGVTVENSYDQRRGGAPRQPQGQHQAVAFKAEGADRLHLEQVRLLGHQDTLYLTSASGDRQPRAFVHASLVAGDVDFIFGPATAYFLASEIRWVGGRREAASGYIAAPSTPLGQPHGFVFDDCDFTSDGGSLAARAGVYLARQWFVGARCSPYGEPAGRCSVAGVGGGKGGGNTGGNTGGNGGEPAAPSPAGDGVISRASLEAVGKMVVLRSRLGPHLQADSPWAPWQADRRARNHRPAQYSSDHFWRLLQAAGLDPAALGYPRADPPEPFLAEYRNWRPGHRTAWP